MSERQQQQRQHEDFWAKRWTIAFGRHINAQVRSSRPVRDPPDVAFHIQRSDGTQRTDWGEITGVYYNSHEAKRLWGATPSNEERGGYWEPDTVLGIQARQRVECKLNKYRELVARRGPGHLLVLLLSRLTGRNARVEAERRIRELLNDSRSLDSDPFESVWLGYHLPWTLPAEQEDPLYAFRDPSDKKRFNFMKCIWSHPHS